MTYHNERYAEELIKSEMKIKLGQNDFGYVYVQGEKCAISSLNTALQNAGAKPKICALDDYTTKGTKKCSTRVYYHIQY